MMKVLMFLAMNQLLINADFFSTFGGTKEQVQLKIDEFKSKQPVGTGAAINWDGLGVQNVLTNANAPHAEMPQKLFLPSRSVIFDDNYFATNDNFQTLLGENVGIVPFSPGITTAYFESESSVLDAAFVLDSDKQTAALVNGFGCVFTDVEKSRKSFIEFYDKNGRLLKKLFAPKGKPHSFVGAIFSEPIVGSIKIGFGENNLVKRAIDKKQKGWKGKLDFVAVDDWFLFKPVDELEQDQVPFMKLKVDETIV